MLLKEQPIVFREGKKYEVLEAFEVKADAYRRLNKLNRFIWYKDNLRVEHLYYGYGIYTLKDIEIEQMELK